MRILLDTHALIWWFTDDPLLSDTARTLISDSRNDILVSSASAWEIATKVRLGKLDAALGVVESYADLIAADGFIHWPVSHRHALRAGSYPQHHRDPFDRMLAAQAELDGLRLLTVDAAFADFPVKTRW